MPIPNVYTATEDPTSQVGNDGDIYFHTGLIGLSAINVYKKVSGRWGLTGTISTTNGSSIGSFLSANIARVDPSGDDGTGAVGDLSKPFLTIQGAINAMESRDNPSDPAVIDLGANTFAEDVTTSLSNVTFIGRPVFDKNANAPLSIDGTITLTNTFEVTRVGVKDAWLGTVTFTESPNGGLLDLTGQAIIDAVNHTGTSGIIINANNFGIGAGNNFSDIIGIGAITPGAGGVNAQNVSIYGDISAAGAVVSLYGCVALGNVICGDFLQADSLIIGTVTASGISTRQDYLLNPALTDFSTLPTSLPARIGAAWIDTTGGLNIIKVKLA